jgi:hypothetical protein
VTEDISLMRRNYQVSGLSAPDHPGVTREHSPDKDPKVARKEALFKLGCTAQQLNHFARFGTSGNPEEGIPADPAIDAILAAK